MNTLSISRRRKRMSPVWAAVLVAVFQGPSRGDQAFVPPDCGLNSLFLLLELSGKPVELERLRRALPSQRRGGYSLLELRDAASACGVSCRGIQINLNDPPPDRPAIVFLSDSQDGHFLVLRPLGESKSSRVQLLDPPSPPMVVEFRKLASDPHWTGRVLVCVTTGETMRAWAGAIVMAVILVGALSVIIATPCRSRRSRSLGSESTEGSNKPA